MRAGSVATLGDYPMKPSPKRGRQRNRREQIDAGFQRLRANASDILTVCSEFSSDQT
jgi:hypothetical protein